MFRRACVLVLAGALAACQSLPQPQQASLALGALPDTLVQPGRVDWTQHLITAPKLVAERAQARRLATAEFPVQRRLQAYPTVPAAWTGGLTLTALTANAPAADRCTATDTVPNGAAAPYRLGSTDPLHNKLIFVTAEGRLLKVDRLNPSAATTVVRKLVGTYTRTFVTMSPRGRRAYLINDAGLLTIVDTESMVVLSTVGPIGGAGGFGSAVWMDPYASAFNDEYDVLYWATNDGKVHKMVVPAPAANDYAVQGPLTVTSYDVATTAVPKSGTRKIAAPAAVVGGEIFVGDQEGVFHHLDTNTNAHVRYNLGAPINTTPALEIQDGTYSLTDPSGNPTSVAFGKPIYLFVNAGASCAWLNLISQRATRSLPLYLDDNANTQFGFLRDYNYSTAGTTQVMAARDGVNLNTENPAVPLPGYEPANRSSQYICPAETNTGDDGTNATGGPIHSFLRWQSPAAAPAGSVVQSATMQLTVRNSQGCRVAEVRRSSHLYNGSASLWASNGITLANQPQQDPGNVGVYLDGGITAPFGNVGFQKNKRYQWDVTSAFPSPQDHYALSLRYNAGGDAVLWPYGPVGGAAGKKAKKAEQVEAVEFFNNPLNADASAAPANLKDDRPLLQVRFASASYPTATVETSPIIDSVRKRVLVFYTNVVYDLDFSSPDAFADADVDVVTGVQTNHTRFNRVALGVVSATGGATYDAKKTFVSNFSLPVVSYDLNSVYALGRYPTTAAATAYNYGLSKLSLPLNNAANRLVAGTASVGPYGVNAANFVLIEPFSDPNNGGNLVYGIGGRLFLTER